LTLAANAIDEYLLCILECSNFLLVDYCMFTYEYMEVHDSNRRCYIDDRNHFLFQHLSDFISSIDHQTPLTLTFIARSYSASALLNQWWISHRSCRHYWGAAHLNRSKRQPFINHCLTSAS